MEGSAGIDLGSGDPLNPMRDGLDPAVAGKKERKADWPEGFWASGSLTLGNSPKARSRVSDEKLIAMRGGV